MLIVMPGPTEQSSASLLSDQEAEPNTLEENETQMS